MGRWWAGRTGKQQDWMVLVPENHQYVKFISDLGGFDLQRYDGQAKTVVPKVMLWLATRPDAVHVPAPLTVIEALPQFQAAKNQLIEKWQGDIPWADLVHAANAIALEL